MSHPSLHIDRLNVELHNGDLVDIDHGLIRQKEEKNEYEVRVEEMPGTPKTAIVFKEDGEVWPHNGTIRIQRTGWSTHSSPSRLI